jgi:DNA uptake protein ComE-like DNA-binding protein
VDDGGRCHDLTKRANDGDSFPVSVSGKDTIATDNKLDVNTASAAELETVYAEVRPYFK